MGLKTRVTFVRAHCFCCVFGAINHSVDVFVVERLWREVFREDFSPGGGKFFNNCRGRCVCVCLSYREQVYVVRCVLLSYTVLYVFSSFHIFQYRVPSGTTSSNQTSLSLFLPSSKDYLDTVTRHCRFRPSVAYGLAINAVFSLLRSVKTTRSRALI